MRRMPGRGQRSGHTRRRSVRTRRASPNPPPFSGNAAASWGPTGPQEGRSKRVVGRAAAAGGKAGGLEPIGGDGGRGWRRRGGAAAGDDRAGHRRQAGSTEGRAGLWGGRRRGGAPYTWCPCASRPAGSVGRPRRARASPVPGQMGGAAPVRPCRAVSTRARADGRGRPPVRPCRGSAHLCQGSLRPQPRPPVPGQMGRAAPVHLCRGSARCARAACGHAPRPPVPGQSPPCQGRWTGPPPVAHARAVSTRARAVGGTAPVHPCQGSLHPCRADGRDRPRPPMPGQPAALHHVHQCLGRLRRPHPWEQPRGPQGSMVKQGVS